MLRVIFDNLPEEGSNRRLLAKSHSGTLRIMDTMRLMWLFLIIARTPIRARLNSYDDHTIMFN